MASRRPFTRQPTGNPFSSVRLYVDFYDQQRPHQGINQQIPFQFGNPYRPLSNKAKGRVIWTSVLHGLHHGYAYAH
jgi:hypothetical protein